MPTVIDEVSGQVIEAPAPEPESSQARGRPGPDMPRIHAELRREAERGQRLWCD